MISINKLRFRLSASILAGLLLFVWACHTSQEPENENVFSLGALADPLKK